MILKDDCKRLIIYFIYDKQGIVDDYIICMLKALKENSSEIAVVCNGLLQSESRKKLENVVSKIIVRENKGLDVWAYKTVIDQYGWECLSTYDEMIMMNFTIMGPVFPLSEMFHSMNAKDIDFWGVSMFHEYKEGDPFGTIDLGYIPDHIQSHFIAVRNRMLNSNAFHEYWDNMQEINDYREAVGCHEAMFTRRFAEKGFSWDVYADLGPTYNNHPILCATKEMIRDKRCPFFKRRSFMQDYTNILSDTMGQNAPETYQYIKDNTEYDVDLIWQNILRLENQADIKKNMQLNYILSNHAEKDMSEVLKTKKIALVIHLYFEELVDYCCSYVRSMPKEADIYITAGNDKLLDSAEKKFGELPNKVTAIKIQNRGRDVSALLVSTKEFIMNYDYVCFMHDKKVVQLTPETIGAGFSYKCFENLLASDGFVLNVLKTFEENPRLGMLTPPPPNHGDYYLTLGFEWGINYKITKKLADELNLTVPITKDKEPIAPLGTMFWFRPKAMKLLFDRDWEYEDFPKEPNKTDGTLLHAIERIYPYVVQQEGYYPAWIFSEKLAAMEITNLQHCLRAQNDIIFNIGPGAGRFEDVKTSLKDVMKQWRLSLNSFGAIYKSKIYLHVNGQFSEKNSVEAELEKTKNEMIFKFNDLESYGVLNCIRWDPGEISATIKSLNMSVFYKDGSVATYGLKDAVINGFFVEGHAVFVSSDPQMCFEILEKSVKKIVVKCKGHTGVGMKEASKITATVNSRRWNIFEKIKGVEANNDGR